MRILTTLRTKLANNRGIPLGALAAKTGSYLRESAAALVYLRQCDWVGTNARVVGVPRVVNAGHITLGHDVRIISRWTPVELSAGPRGTLTIGDGTSMNYGTLIAAADRVSIGQRVMIGNYCVIADTRVPGSPADATDVPRPIEIGDDVWLAVRVTVLPGSKIGAGAVISAGSVVDGEIPPGVLAGGVPARVLQGSLRPPSLPDLREGVPRDSRGVVPGDAVDRARP